MRTREVGNQGEEWDLFGKRTTTTETNTLTLIRRWSMAGAPGDLDGRFGSPLDINAAVAESSEEPRPEVLPPTPPTLLMKPADEDDWRPLLVGVPDPA